MVIDVVLAEDIATLSTCHELCISISAGDAAMKAGEDAEDSAVQSRNPRLSAFH